MPLLINLCPPQLRTGSERLLGVVNRLSSALMSNQVPGKASTTLTTGSLTLSVAKVVGADIDQAFTVAGQQEETQAEVSLTEEIPVGEQAEVGVQVVA